MKVFDKILKLFKIEKAYEYMVVYSIPNGLGRIFITRNVPIAKNSYVEELDKFIMEQNGLSHLFITNFKLLRTYYKRIEE